MRRRIMVMETAQTGGLALRALSEVAALGAAGAAQMAEVLGVSRTAAQRLMGTLHEVGMLRRQADGRYALGPMLLQAADGVSRAFASRASATVRALAQQVQMSIVLSVRDGDQSVVVRQAAGATQFMHVEYTEGFRRRLSVGASGLAILAFLDEEERRRLEPEVPDDVIQRVVAAGFATSEGAIRPGMAGIAVPVSQRRVGVFASLSAVAPVARISDRAADRVVVVDALMRAGAALSEVADQQLGADGEAARG